LSTIQVEHSDQVIRDKRLSLNVPSADHKSPSINDQYLALIQRNNSRLSSNDSSTDQANRRYLNPILDGGTGTPNNPMPSEPAAEFAQRKVPPSKQTPNLKKDQMVYLSQP
jgi:hypothetical protein